MQDDYWDFHSMNWGVFLFSVIPALINIGIFFYISFFLNNNQTNRLFSFFVLLLGVSQISDELMRMSMTDEKAIMWAKVSGQSMILALAFGVLFAFRFSGWHKKVNYSAILPIILIPTIISSVLMVTNNGIYTVIRSRFWRWIANPQPQLITDIIYLNVLLWILAIFIILWDYYFREKINKRRKKQALILAIGFTIPVVGGVVTEMFLPLVLKIEAIPLGTPIITIFSISTLIAMNKYRFLDYSPRHQWNKIVEHMDEGVLIVDISGKIKYANQTFCKLVEYEFEEIVDKNAYELFVEDESQRARIRDFNSNISHTVSNHFEMLMKAKSGGKKWVLLNQAAYLGNNNEIIGFIGLLTNISYLKEVENKIKSSEEKLKHAQAVAHVGSWELDFKTGQAIWSDEACKIYGLSPAENIHTFKNWFSFIHPDDLSLVNSEIAKAQATNSDLSMEHRIVLRDQTVKYIRSISTYQFDEKGKPIGLFGTCMDINESKKTEEKLMKVNQELETYIYKASHDLKTPVSSIMGLINVSRLEVQDENALKYFAMIDSMAKKLNNMLSELVKSMAIKDTAKFNDEINFDELVQESISKFIHRKELPKLNIRTNITLDSPVFSNKFILSTIFQNIIENAIKYQNFKQPYSFLKINVSSISGKLKIQFEDNGIGIEESQQTKIFDMYYRANQQSDGSGLGLYLIKKGVEKLNGTIQISSKLGVGTVTTITIDANCAKDNEI